MTDSGTVDPDNMALSFPPLPTRVVIEVWRQGSAHTVTISTIDDRGYGSGYRISGPKTGAHAQRVGISTLSDRDANEIHSILANQFPSSNLGGVEDRLRLILGSDNIEQV